MTKTRVRVRAEYTRSEEFEVVVDSDVYPDKLDQIQQAVLIRSDHDLARIVKLTTVARRNGAVLDCGCWIYATVGSVAGQHRSCDLHKQIVKIARCNVDEPDGTYFA